MFLSRSPSMWTYNPPGAANTKGGTSSIKKSLKVPMEMIGMPCLKYTTPFSKSLVLLFDPMMIGEPRSRLERICSSLALSLLNASTLPRILIIKRTSSLLATISKLILLIEYGSDTENPMPDRTSLTSVRTSFRLMLETI